VGEVEPEGSGAAAHDPFELGDGLALQPAVEAHDLNPRVLVERDAQGHTRPSLCPGAVLAMEPLARVIATE
jgi:hypothetical protein